MTAHTKLSSTVIARCDADNLPPDHDLRRLAKEFDEATAKMDINNAESDNTKRFLGAWARLRRAWCEYSGESLL
jgi:hypothetical protein